MKRKILVVDAADSILKMISIILGNEYQVLTRNSGVDAVNLLDAGNLPELIISDLHMPAHLGEPFIDSIKSSSATREIPVILTSVSEDLETHIARLPFKINTFLKKPFNSSDLKSAVKMAL